MSLKKNLGYNFLLSVSQLLIPLITIPYISRVLTPDGVGRVAFIDSFSYYFTVVAEFGIVAYGIREIGKVKDDPALLSKLVSELLFIRFITSSLSFVLYGTLMWVLWEKVDNARLAIYSASFLLSYFLYCEWYFWGTQQFKFISIRSILIRLVGVAGIFLLIRTSEDYPSYYFVIAFSAIATVLLSYFRMSRQLKVSFRNLNWRRHLPFLVTNYGISLLYSAFIMLDTPLLRLRSSAEAAGIYMVAIKIIRISSTFISDSMLVLYPHTVAVRKEQNLQAERKNLMRSSQLILMLSWPLAVGTFLLADDLTVVYLGASFSEVATLLKLLSLYPVLSTFNMFVSKQLLQAYDAERYNFKSLLAGALVLLISTYFLSARYAAAGAAIALLIAESVTLLLNLWYAYRLHNSLRIFDLTTIGHIFLGALLFIPFIAGLRWFGFDQLLLLITGITGSILIYFIWMIFVARTPLISQLFHDMKGLILSKIK